MKALRAELDELKKAAIKYDEAIQACGNDPDTMATYCTAEGDTLDSLYDKWVSLARVGCEKEQTREAQPQTDICKEQVPDRLFRSTWRYCGRPMPCEVHGKREA